MYALEWIRVAFLNRVSSGPPARQSWVIIERLEIDGASNQPWKCNVDDRDGIENSSASRDGGSEGSLKLAAA